MVSIRRIIKVSGPIWERLMFPGKTHGGLPHKYFFFVLQAARCLHQSRCTNRGRHFRLKSTQVFCRHFVLLLFRKDFFDNIGSFSKISIFENILNHDFCLCKKLRRVLTTASSPILSCGKNSVLVIGPGVSTFLG